MLALGAGLLLYAFLLAVAGWGVAVTLVAPFAIGTLIGFGIPTGWIGRAFATLIIAVAILGLLFGYGLVGVFCGLVLAVIMIAPLVVGVLCGTVLRLRLKRSAWEQRWHLPTLLVILLPAVWGVVERLTAAPYALESVVTRIEMPVPVGRAWTGVMFYEEVYHRPPWLLRLGLPRPLYTFGSTSQVGDRKTCVYTKGRLTKQVTARAVNQRLDFAVVQQDHIENHSVRLTGGSFVFRPSSRDSTKVELTTTYQPKLGPRWVWRPFENKAIHALHGYVLEGMRDKAEHEP
jgi:hypothetical protein